VSQFEFQQWLEKPSLGQTAWMTPVRHKQSFTTFRNHKPLHGWLTAGEIKEHDHPPASEALGQA
jgi:hypothetical protein